MRQLIVPFAVLALTAGCAHAPPPIPITPPTLVLESFIPQQFDAYGVTLSMHGRLENPNPVSVPVDVFTYQISIDGQPAGGGKVSTGIVLPANGSVPARVPARLEWASVPHLLELLATHGGEAPCQVTGAALVPNGSQYLELPYAVSGTVGLPFPPKVSMGKVVLQKSDLFETIIEVQMNVQNPNKFPLPNGRLAYNLTLSGVSVVNGGNFALTDVPPGEPRLIAIPVRFSTVGAAAGAIASILRGANADVAFSGSAGYGGLEAGLDARATLAR